VRASRKKKERVIGEHVKRKGGGRKGSSGLTGEFGKKKFAFGVVDSVWSKARWGKKIKGSTMEGRKNKKKEKHDRTKGDWDLPVRFRGRRDILEKSPNTASATKGKTERTCQRREKVVEGGDRKKGA